MRRTLSYAALLSVLPGCEVLLGDDGYARPVSSTNTWHFEFLEQNAQVVYPAIALLTLGLIAFGIILTWRSQGLDGKTKSKLKREIVQELRRQMGGMTGEQVAKSIALEPFKTVKLLEEMVKEGLILSHTNTQRIVVYRLRGVGPG